MKQLTLLFLLRDNQVLLAMKKRGFEVGRWNGVGGKVEPGETTEQALVRECQEEIGVTPVEYTQKATILFHEFDGTTPHDMQVHVFTATKWQGEPTESEEMRPEWFNQSELPFDDMWPDDIHWLPQVLGGKTVEAEFNLDDHDAITDFTVHVS